MGLTFTKQDNLEKLFDKFAVVPDKKKKSAAKKNKTEDKK
ncbi:SPJ_0845 family protein [Lactobacillus sp. ESL0791]|nr:SPJ_0845 family protein [Lactobacillus sp. ESL0791]MDF7638851.1 SPJ_0845 family protein [Lactobacillus sp. ESL0791]